MPTGNVTLYPGIDGYVLRQAESTWDAAHDAVGFGTPDINDG